MELANTILQKHNIPLSPNLITFFDYCGSKSLTTNELPNCTIEFTSTTEHKLKIKGLIGIGEALQVLELELDPSFYSPTDEADPQYNLLLKRDPIELRRYTHATIGNVDYINFDEKLIYAFIEHREAVLHLHPISGS